MAMGRGAARSAPEPLCRFINFLATDGVELSGLLYEPPRRTRRAAVFLHGTGGASIFGSRRTNLLAGEMLQRGIAFLPFDNRGAHLLRRLRVTPRAKRRSVGGGMAHELIRDCVYDIDGAARSLRVRGYRELFLIGHSTGANKIAVYDQRKKRNPFRKYVLLAGGDDTGLMYQHLGRRRFAATLGKAHAMIRSRRGDEIVPAKISALPMSWRSLYDMINPDGDYNVFPFGEIMNGVRLSRRPRFRHLRGIRKPSLVVYGERDEYCYDDVSWCVRILADAIGPRPNFDLVVMKDADHGFGGEDRNLGALAGDWLLG